MRLLGIELRRRSVEDVKEETEKLIAKREELLRLSKAMEEKRRLEKEIAVIRRGIR